MMHRVLMATLWLAACERSRPAPTAAEVPSASPSRVVRSESNTLAPVVVRVRGPAEVRAGEQLDLVVSIERRALSATPLVLSWQLPAGVSLRAGQQEEVIVDARELSLTRQITLDVAQVPATDVVVSVSERAPDHGAYATDHYRFGRPAPSLPQPYDRAIRRPGFPGATIPIGAR